jgi:hypothetical protein
MNLMPVAAVLNVLARKPVIAAVGEPFDLEQFDNARDAFKNPRKQQEIEIQ